MNTSKSILFSVLVIFCSSITLSQPNPNFMPLADSFNVNNPHAVQAINIPYGSDDPRRQLFHMFLPQREGTFPLVIFYHGGGFTDGNPGTVFKDPERREVVKYFLENNVAYMSVGYRLIEAEGPDPDGVIKCLTDAKLGLQFIRHHAESLHIDPDRIALMGSSAGGGTSLWLGTHSDMADPEATDPVLRTSTRVSAIFVSGSQATYDLYKWETDIFNNYDGQGNDFTVDSIAAIMTAETTKNFYGGMDSLYQMVHDPALIAYRQEVDMLNQLTSDDPPLYIFSQSSADHPSDDVLHHWYHSREMYQVAVGADLKEVKAEIRTPAINTTDGESGYEFLLRHLNDVENIPLSTEKTETLALFPNPARSHFYVHLPTDEVHQVDVISQSGRVVSSFENLEKTAPIPISTLSEGVYLVRVYSENTKTLGRLVVR